MTLNISNGFILPQIQTITINSKDAEKYGIKSEDWAKVDTNNDGIITASEFINKGMNISSIFNTYKTLATNTGAYIEGPQQTQTLDPINDRNFAQNSVQQPFSLNHPQVKNSFLANNCDFMA